MVAHGDLRGDVDECVRVLADWLDAELRQRQKVNGDSGQRIWGEDDAAGAKPGHKLNGILYIKRWGHQALLTSMNSDLHCILQISSESADSGGKLQLRPCDAVIAGVGAAPWVMA